MEYFSQYLQLHPVSYTTLHLVSVPLYQTLPAALPSGVSCFVLTGIPELWKELSCKVFLPDPGQSSLLFHDPKYIYPVTSPIAILYPCSCFQILFHNNCFIISVLVTAFPIKLQYHLSPLTGKSVHHLHSWYLPSRIFISQFSECQGSDCDHRLKS